MSQKKDKVKENNSIYDKLRNEKNFIGIRLNVEERTLLNTLMQKEGWENKSSFIKHCIFGDEPVEDIVSRVCKKTLMDNQVEFLVILLRECVLELANKYDYIRYRYDKDMGQLYKERGVDVKKWAKVTNENHIALLQKTEEIFQTIHGIAEIHEEFFSEYFNLPSDKMKLSDDPTREEINALAEQMRKERIAMGHPDPNA